MIARHIEALPLSRLKGVGTKTLLRLDKLGIRSVQDLLFHLPLRYDDRTVLSPIGQLRHGHHALLEGRVELTEITPTGRRALICRLSDGTGFINLRFFHFTADQRDRLRPGQRVRCFGEVREGFFGIEMVHPECQPITEDEAGCLENTLTPVYPTTEGLHQKTLRSLIGQALALCLNGNAVTDWIPLALRSAVKLSPLEASLRLLHQPSADVAPDSLKRAQQSLAFEELLAHHLSLSRFRLRMQSHSAPPLCMPDSLADAFLKNLPFSLTSAQRRVIREIAVDLGRSKPMMRLIQGDVGSGKTVLAAWAALAALASGFQAAVMAPTELLAGQHLRSFSQWLAPLGIEIEFLAGKHKGNHRREVLAAIAEGRARLVVGTHALFQQEVQFKRLGLVIIDEQHRFGVHQRLALREKGTSDGGYPHQLIMTATPIPRTLAMLGYADLDVSVIDELPPGRTPVNTTVIPAQRRPDVVARIAEWIVRGRQVYWVCTLIEESEVLQCEAAEKTALALTEALPTVRVALMHGRMKTAEKEDVMQAFKSGQVDLLVATTVIEVGVDVANAGLMVIENPERLGLAQLHQLRGRVGRGPGESFCVLLYQQPLSRAARERLGIIRDTHDGFAIAERDLELRGPGELMGVRQAGQVQFRIADLVRDAACLREVRHCAEEMLSQYPECVDPLLQRWLGSASRFADV